MRIFTIGYPFCGSGLGASGSDAAVATHRGQSATFRNLGGIDFDAVACRDFEMLTGAKAMCSDVKILTPEQLRSFWGARCPDVIEGSAPCKKASGLLPKKQAANPKYDEMNELMIIFSELLFRTYGDDGGPALAIWENVPNLLARAPEAVEAMVRTWTRRGYLVSYAKHNLGKEGGIAQHRERLAIVFRHPGRCPAPMTLPPEKPLKAVGEVLGKLPWPDDPRMALERDGKLVTMHALPRLEWVNMVRLALIGINWGDGRKPKWDWRDLPPRGQVEEWLRARGLWPVAVGEKERARLEEALLGAPSHKRNEVFRREPVESWAEPSPTVTGPGGPGLHGIQDVRPVEALAIPTDNEGRHATKYAVWPDQEPGRTVTGALQVGSGGPSVADGRVRELAFGHQGKNGSFGILSWKEPSTTVTGNPRPGGSPTASAVADARPLESLGQSMGAVADPGPVEALALTHHRGTRFTDQYRVQDWSDPPATVTGRTDVQEGAPLAADPRPVNELALGNAKCPPRGNQYTLGAWAEPGATVTSAPGWSHGAPCAADPRSLERLAEGATGDNAASFNGRPGFRQVGAWAEPASSVIATAAATSGNGYAAAADPRPLEGLGLGCRAYNTFYGVLHWERPANTVTASLQVDCGPAAVADPRPVPRPRAVISLGMAIQLLAEGWEVPKGALAPAIIAPDGAWHRPLTTLELAVIQSLPAVLDGKPLVLHGGSDRLRREHIGNGIPRAAAEAWGRQALDSLLRSSMGEGFRLVSSNLWVQDEEEMELAS